jgi:hypothetical protein
MRYWMGKPVIDFINEQGMDQAEYEAWLKKNNFSINHPDASLHNRVYVEEYEKKIIATNSGNIKVTANNNHVEVIFDKYGDTVSQWKVFEMDSDGKIKSGIDDYSKKDLSQIANTDSVNYAEPYDGLTIETPIFTIDFDTSGPDHDKLDVSPAGSKKGLESDIRVEAKKEYPVPKNG